MVVYMVWAYDQYYPTGPNDLKGVFTRREDADALYDKLHDGKEYDHVELTCEELK